MLEVPDAIDIVILGNRPDAARVARVSRRRDPCGCDANALHDALGVRLRRVPLTPDAVLQPCALKKKAH